MSFELDRNRLLSAYIRTRSTEDRNRLAECCSHWLSRRASVMYRGFRGRLEFGDLYQAGAVALLKSIEQYDPANGKEFINYAFTRVIGAMRELARRADHLKRKQREKVRRGEASFPEIVRFGDLEFGSEGVDIADVLADLSPSPTKPAEDADAANRVLKSLDKQARRAMRLYFFNHLTMKAAGQRMRLSEGRISQIIRDSLALLREQFGGQLELVG